MVRATENAKGISADELLKLENQLCFPLYACSKEIVRRYTPLLDELGLTYTQYLTMMALWEYGSMSVGELGHRLYLDSGTLTPMLKKMEAKGLLERKRSTEDERRVEIALTPAGKDLKKEAAKVPIEMGRCVDLAPEDAIELVRLLHKVLDGLGDDEPRG